MGILQVWQKNPFLIFYFYLATSTTLKPSMKKTTATTSGSDEWLGKHRFFFSITFMLLLPTHSLFR